MSTPLYLITGAMAAGKSTIAKELVQRFESEAPYSSTSGKILPRTPCADSLRQDLPHFIKTF